MQLGDPSPIASGSRRALVSTIAIITICSGLSLGAAPHAGGLSLPACHEFSIETSRPLCSTHPQSGPQLRGMSSAPNPGHSSAWTPLRSRDSAAPTVADTLVLSNNTLVAGNFLAPDAVGPAAVAYDSNQGEIFVASAESPTVTVLAAESLTVVATIAIQSDSEGLVYDSGTGQIFVSDTGTKNVSVISPVTNSVVATVPVGSDPWGMAYDGSSHQVFVANKGGNTVSVIWDSNDSVATTVVVGQGPSGVAYDDLTNTVWVTNMGTTVTPGVSWFFIITSADTGKEHKLGLSTSDGPIAFDPRTNEMFFLEPNNENLTIINATSEQNVATLGLGEDPAGVVYDSNKDEMFVTNSGSNSVTEIGDNHSTILGTIDDVNDPTGVGVDIATGGVFVADQASDAVTVISDRSDSVVATIAIGANPEGLAFDPVQKEIFVTNSGLDQVDVISNLTERIVARIAVGSEPYDLAYDDGTHELFVTNLLSDNVSVIDDSTDQVTTSIGVGSAPASLAYDAAGREIFVLDTGSDAISILSDATNSLVATVVLPDAPSGVAYDSGTRQIFVTVPGANIIAVFNGTTDRWEANVTGIGGFAIAYDGVKSELFVSGPGSGNVSVVSDSSDSVLASVPVSSAPSALAYDPGRGQLVAADAPANNLTLVADAADRATGTIEVGADPTSVAYDSADYDYYVTNYVQGTVSVIPAGRPIVSDVNFTERGLPAGTQWSATLNGSTRMSTSSDISYTEANGRYYYSISEVRSYQDKPPSGIAAVDDSNVTLTITFSLIPTYVVRFNASGLPDGDEWWANLSNGVSGSGTFGTSSTSITVAEPNGSYSYTLTSSNKIFACSGGIVVVNGKSVEENVTYAPVTFSVTFSESGLPAASKWWVNLTFGALSLPSLSSTAGNEITALENGTYSFTVASANRSYSASGGTFEVSGSPVVKDVAFHLRGNSPSGASGPSGIEEVYLIGGLAVAALAAIGGVIYLRRRGRGRGPPREAPESGPGS